MKIGKQDKGQRACVAAFVDAIENGSESPIVFSEFIELANATFDIVDIVDMLEK